MVVSLSKNEPTQKPMSVFSHRIVQKSLAQVSQKPFRCIDPAAAAIPRGDSETAVDAATQDGLSSTGSSVPLSALME